MNMSINNNGIIGMPMPQTTTSAGDVGQKQSWSGAPVGPHERRHGGRASMTSAGRHALPPQLAMPNHQNYLPGPSLQFMQHQPPPMLFMQQQPQQFVPQQHTPPPSPQQQYTPQQFQQQYQQPQQHTPPPSPQQYQFTQFDPRKSELPSQQATQSAPSKFESRPLPSGLLTPPSPTTSSSSAPPAESTTSADSPSQTPSKTIGVSDLLKGAKWLGKKVVNGTANAVLNKYEETKENWSTPSRPTHIKVGSQGGSDD